MVSVPGDPAAMRAAASMLRMRAETLSEVASRLDSQVQSLEFEGPAADLFRETMLLRRQTADSLVSQLASVADEIIRAATEVEQAQLLAGGQV
jgi:WXG100 family type VII secretion target